ncbi:MAG: glycosyltransferase family 2 protein, partial [Terriglobales bacterium]
IENCLHSIFESKPQIEFEVIVSDNGSTDGSVERIREQFPAARLVENGANLGFAKGNNAGIREARGEYVLILNPDTVMHAGSLDRWIEFADRWPKAGAFGCRILNPDGTYQESARPFPTVRRSLIAALGLRGLGRLTQAFLSDNYEGWKGNSERDIDWQSGCCVLFRGELLKKLGGFDERFFYHYEEVDLCHRVWEAGYTIRFTPEVTVTHLGGQSVGRFPVRFALETNRNCYRYFYKHFGAQGTIRCRQVTLTHLRIRQCGYSVKYWFRPSDSLKGRLDMYLVTVKWNTLIDPVRFVEDGTEPQIEQEPSVSTS